MRFTHFAISHMYSGTEWNCIQYGFDMCANSWHIYKSISYSSTKNCVVSLLVEMCIEKWLNERKKICSNNIQFNRTIEKQKEKRKTQQKSAHAYRRTNITMKMTQTERMIKKTKNYANKSDINVWHTFQLSGIIQIYRHVNHASAYTVNVLIRVAGE